MADELSAPLGKKKPKFRLPKFGLPKFKGDLRTIPIGRVLTGILLVFVGIVGARIAFFDDPQGGRPQVDVAINSSQFANPVAQDVIVQEQNTGSQSSQSATSSETTMEVGPEIAVIDAPNNGPQITIVDVDPATSSMETLDDVQNLDRTLNEFGAYPELLEQTQHGLVPRISATGETPFAAYGRASIGPETAAGKPLIAIVMTGLGLNESATLDAISRLPGNITLAFAPYGRTLQRTASAAQSNGHELLLEIPMEPFDYPESDPGPHTLLTNQPLRTNLDRLFWLMARFGGYVGLINNQGARFSSSAADFSPVMEEMGIRGIGYVDDGTSNRSLSRQLATANRIPYVRAQMRLDTNPSRGAILAALDQLEQEAVANGSALGIISALPVSINTLVAWSAQLEDRGILLVPASALMAQGSAQ